MKPEEKENLKNHAETLLKELQAEMRAIRDAELKMVPFFFAVAAFVLTATLLATLNDKVSLSTVLWVTAPSFVFIVAFWVQLHRRISDEHEKHADLGRKVRQLWDLLGVADFCKPLDGRPEFGAGSGYRKSQWLVASSALVVLLIIAATTAIKLRALICP